MAINDVRIVVPKSVLFMAFLTGSTQHLFTIPPGSTILQFDETRDTQNGAEIHFVYDDGNDDPVLEVGIEK